VQGEGSREESKVLGDRPRLKGNARTLTRAKPDKGKKLTSERVGREKANSEDGGRKRSVKRQRYQTVERNKRFLRSQKRFGGYSRRDPSGSRKKKSGKKREENMDYGNDGRGTKEAWEGFVLARCKKDKKGSGREIVNSRAAPPRSIERLR